MKKASQKPVESRFINCRKEPAVISEDWQVYSHARTPSFAWDPRKISLYQSPAQQKDGKWVTPYRTLNELENKVMLNANVLDFLLQHNGIIPKAWRPDKPKDAKEIFFAGTRYLMTSDGFVYEMIRSLKWLDSEWVEDSRCFQASFTEIDFVAVYNGRL